MLSLDSLLFYLSHFSLPSTWNWFHVWCEVGIKINKEKPLDSSQCLRKREHPQTLPETKRGRELLNSFYEDDINLIKKKRSYKKIIY